MEREREREREKRQLTTLCELGQTQLSINWGDALSNLLSEPTNCKHTLFATLIPTTTTTTIRSLNHTPLQTHHSDSRTVLRQNTPPTLTQIRLNMPCPRSFWLTQNFIKSNFIFHNFFSQFALWILNAIAIVDKSNLVIRYVINPNFISFLLFYHLSLFNIFYYLFSKVNRNRQLIKFDHSNFHFLAFGSTVIRFKFLLPTNTGTLLREVVHTAVCLLLILSSEILPTVLFAMFRPHYRQVCSLNHST